MKKTILILTASLLLTANWAMATATLSFNDGLGTPDVGSYTPGQSFSFDITLSVTSGAPNAMSDVQGLSYWFATSAVNTGYFSITDRNLSGSPFSLAITPGITYPQPIGSEPGGAVHGGNPDDLGANTPSASGVASDANYFVATLTIAINPLTPVGTYTIFTTSSGSNPSEANDSSFEQFNFPAQTYTITVVPEPATWSLFALGGLATVGVSLWRARRRA